MRQPRVYRDKRTRNALGAHPWCVDYSEPNGTRHRVRTEATTKEEAQRILGRIMGEVAEARAEGRDFIEGSKLTLEEFVERHYWPDHEARCGKVTVEQDTHHMKPVAAAFGKKPLTSIKVEDVADFMSGMKRDGFADATVNRRRAILSGILGLAERLGKIDRNPAKRVPQLEVHNRKTRVFSFAEEAEILKRCPEWFRSILGLALETGMRREEIASMGWEDVDIRRGFILIPETKNGEPRSIPMNARLRDLILAIRPQEIAPKGPVFVNAKTGQGYDPSTFTHSFDDAIRRAGLKGEGRNSGSFHTLRHTVAWRLRKAKVQELFISLLLGHSVENNITARYGRPGPEDLWPAVNALVELRKSGDLGTDGAPAEMGRVAANG